MGGAIRAVSPGSPAQLAGILPGDKLLAIDGEPVRDVIDVEFRADEPGVELLLRRGNRDLRVTIGDYAGHIGLEFEDALFDGIAECANHCAFCFVDQLPSGLRPTLYVKDDDYRLSFLHGAYVTLTNLSPADESRIVNQRLSPLYVSVQAVTPEVRQLMFGTGRARDPGIIARLASGGIRLHCQIVLCPGINDGAELVRTLEFLESLGAAVRSAAVVPVGLTAHRCDLPGVRPCTSADAVAALDAVDQFRSRWRRVRTRGVVQASDELYLLAGRPVPGAEEYDGYQQLENGVGLIRRFLDSLNGRVMVSPEPVAIVTGRMFAPILTGHAGEGVRVIAVDNRLLGPQVTVAGLLAGSDIIDRLRRERLPGGSIVLIPAAAVRTDDQEPEAGQFIDDLTPGDIARELDVRVRVISPDASSLLAAVEGGPLT